MELPKIIHDEIELYHKTYRHPDLERPTVSGIYALHPDEFDSAGATSHWPQTWPQCKKPGVYLIFNKDLKLLYVGKAKCFGQRLNAHFRYTDDGSKRCTTATGGWSDTPAFLVTVALSNGFEAPSMEEYLIDKLRPSDNRLGVTFPNGPDA